MIRAHTCGGHAETTRSEISARNVLMLMLVLVCRCVQGACGAAVWAAGRGKDVSCARAAEAGTTCSTGPRALYAKDETAAYFWLILARESRYW